MLYLRNLYLRLCYVLIFTVLTLKIGFFFTTITFNNTSSIIESITTIFGSEGSFQLFDLFSNSTSNENKDFVDFKAKFLISFLIKPQALSNVVFEVEEKSSRQFFPIPSICSHTGIFLCLRL